MYCTNTVRVRASLEHVFALAADVERWPVLLPHYRWVRVLRRVGARTWLDMAARRGRIPVRWQAVQEVYPAGYLVTYRHVGGLTRGMRVLWQLVPDGTHVEVTIRHTFTPPWPYLGGWPAQQVVGRFFVEHIASQTLRCLRAHAEAGARAAAPATDGSRPATRASQTPRPPPPPRAGQRRSASAGGR